METCIVLNESDWEAFHRALDEPPAPNEDLKKFLAKESPWESRQG